MLRMDVETSQITNRVWLARGIAMIADALQIGLAPIIVEPLGWPVNSILDIVVAIVLTRLVGWHIAFLPGFVIEQIPFANLAPTWTLAVMIATRGKTNTSTITP